jgi:hypothetical protein
MSAPLFTSYVVLWCLVIILAIAVFALYQHFGQMYLVSREGRASQGPAVDQPLGSTPAEALNALPFVVPAPEIITAIVFADTKCRLCERLKPDIERFALRHESIETVIICGGTRRDVEAWADGLCSDITVIPDPNQRLAARYRIGLTPFVVAVDDGGVVRMKGLVHDEEGLEEALDAVVLAGHEAALEESELR